MSSSALLHQPPLIGDIIIDMIERHGPRNAFVDHDGTTVSFTELGEMIRAATTRLRSLGVCRGDTVMQIVSNRVHAFVIMASCYLAGYRSVALQPRMGNDDHTFIANDCEPKVIVADAAVMDRVQRIAGALKRPAIVFSHEHGAAVPFFWECAGLVLDELRSEAEPFDIVRIQYTGGTTGKPKGVMATSSSMAMNAMTRLAGHNWTALRFLCSSPITHATGSIIVPVLWHGGSIVLHSGFDEDRLLKAVEGGDVNAFYAVPTMLYALLDHPRTRSVDFSNLRMIMYGAAPASPRRIQEALNIFGPVMIQHYGCTEAPAVVLTLNEEDHLNEHLLASAGKAYPGVTVRLLDESDASVQRGQVGEICVRGPMVMSGYHQLPELTAEVTRNGWIHTGDMARQDDRGYFYIVDRKKDMIISGGFNVYAKEVEDALVAHDSVLAAAVIGVPDSKWGEAVKAVVVLRSGARVTETELAFHVRERKGPVCTPKSFEFVDVLPLTPLGKVDKNAMRDPYWQGVNRRVN
jgi:fatty-acyl-CoA synthase